VCLLNLLIADRPLRRNVKAIARAALAAACVIVFTLSALAKGDAVADTSSPLREKDVRRAEEVVARLRLLNEAALKGDDPRAFPSLAGKLYPGLFITIADMREGDLKTDLDTAAFLYEAVSRSWFNASDSSADCGRERRDIYLPLCLELHGGTMRRLLLAKARLHARWAEASVDYYRGGRGAETLQSLSAMKAAREEDSVIASQVLEMLKTLEGLATNRPKHAGYQWRRDVDGSDTLDAEFDDALAGAGALIASMPRNPTFYYLSNAWCCYRDGLSWEQKVSRSKTLVVSANGFARDPLKELGLDADMASRTVSALWNKATKYTGLAEQSLRGRGDEITLLRR
jgi:hypothetical protein